MGGGRIREEVKDGRLRGGVRIREGARWRIEGGDRN